MATLPADLQDSLNDFRANPSVVTFDPDGTPLNLYVESVEVSFGSERAPINHPVAGAYEEYVMDEQITVTLEVPEESSDIFALMNPAGYDYGSGRTGFGAIAGHGMRTHAQKMRIRPYDSLSSETPEIIIWNAIPDGDLSEALAREDAATFSVTFKSLIDASKPDGALHGNFKIDTRA